MRQAPAQPNQLDLEQLIAELVTAVHDTVQPEQAFLALPAQAGR